MKISVNEFGKTGAITSIKKLMILGICFFVIGCSRSEVPAEKVADDNAVLKNIDEPTAKVESVEKNGTKEQVEPLAWYVKKYMGDRAHWILESEVRDQGFAMYEVTQYPDKEATLEQKRLAEELIEKTFNAVKAKGWLVKEKALKDGYDNMYKDQIHYVNKEYLYDGKMLDPESPEFLMYYPTEHGELLLGVMFASDGHGPQIGGPLTLWHYHVEQGICYENGFLPIGLVNEKGQCEKGVTRQKTPEMLHLWFFDHPDGRFATRMRLSEEHFQLAKEQVFKLYSKQ